MSELPITGEALQHDFVLAMLVPITSAELERFKKGQRIVFRKVDPRDESQVRASAVFCATCQLPYEGMGWGELERCRGSIDEDA